jgi:hypothetical protein
MIDLIVAEKIAQWKKLKAFVLDNVSSPITKRVVKSAKSVGIRTGNWLSVRQAQNLLNAPDISGFGVPLGRSMRYPRGRARLNPTRSPPTLEGASSSFRSGYSISPLVGCGPGLCIRPRLL